MLGTREKCSQENCKILPVKEALNNAGLSHGCYCDPKKHWPNTEYKPGDQEPLGCILLTGKKFKGTLVITQDCGNR